MFAISYSIAFAISLPALNFKTFFAGILIFSPDFGLRPTLASFFCTENVPKPKKATF